MQKRIKLTIDDALFRYDPSIKDYFINATSIKTTAYFIKVPEEWLENDKILALGLERFYRYLYGVSWRIRFEDDDPRYLPVDVRLELVEDTEQKPWLSEEECFELKPDHPLIFISPSDF